jgi:aminopeptidase N
LNASAQLTKEDEFYSDSSLYDVTFYKIDLSLSKSSIYIKGNTTIIAKSKQNYLQNFYIELSDSLSIDSLKFNNINSSFEHTNGWIKVHLLNPVLNNNSFSVQVFYHGNGSGRGFGGIIHDSIYNSNILSVLAEPYNSLVFFPCKQNLPDKADSVFLYITVPKGEVVATNGLLKKTVELPSNKIQFQWETRYPIAYYLIAFAISDYKQYTYKFFDEIYGDSVLFQNFIYNDQSFYTESKQSIDETVDIIKLYEKLTGVAFPFRKEKYGHATIPFGGGMENQTITMLSRFDFVLVAHELGHSWFGDMVTCADWQNIWVNEGFATYMSYLAMENLKPELKSKWLKDTKKEALEEPDEEIFVPESQKWDDYRVFNSSLTYSKGGMLLHMLRKKLNNDKVFFEIFKTYLNKYAYKNATADDFRKVAEEISGKDLKTFFNQWFYGKGFPIAKVKWMSNSKGLTINTSSIGSSPSNPIFDCDIELLLQLKSGKDSLIKINLKDTSQTFVFKQMPLIDSVIADPYNALVAQISVSRFISDGKEVSVFPNPFTDTVVIMFRNNSGKHFVELYDIKGAIVNKWKTNNSELTMPLESLIPGIYIVRIKDDKGFVTKKIIKRRNE